MTDQPELLFDRPRGKGPRVNREAVDQLIEALFHTHSWMTADDLGFHTESDKRIVRALAAASGGHVISGQGGYRLHFEATSDESRVSTGKLRHQVAEMTRRVVEQERVYHRKEVPECLLARVQAARHSA